MLLVDWQMVPVVGPCVPGCVKLSDAFNYRNTAVISRHQLAIKSAGGGGKKRTVPSVVI